MKRGFWLIVAALLVSTPAHTFAQDHISVWSPRTPLTPEEAFAYTKSSIFTLALSTAINQLNQYPVFNGEPRGIKNINGSIIGITGFPFIGGSLIFSREIVTGNYLGTDNVIQLADQFGINISTGLQVGTEDLPLPVRAGFNGSVSVSRIFSHLKPITSIRGANRFAFKNAIVPLFIKQNANTLSPLSNNDFEQLPINEKKAIYQSSLQEFLEKIAPGESILITDSLNSEAMLTANTGIYKMIDLSGTARASEIVIRRLHIFRKDHNTFQIYEDSGCANQPSLAAQIGLRIPIPHQGIRLFYAGKTPIDYARMPIITAKWGKNNGDAKTRFFEIKIDHNPESEAKLNAAADKLRKLRMTLLEGNSEPIENISKPFVIDHDFHENNMQDRILIFSQRKLHSTSTLSFKSDDEVKHTYIRNFFGKSNGFDYTNPGSHSLTFAKEFITRSSGTFGDDTTLNPGYNSRGFARNRLLLYEAEKLNDGSIINPFVRITRIYNGWNGTAPKIQNLLNHYQKNYGDGDHPPIEFKESENLFLYTIGVNFKFNEDAIHHLESLDKDQLKEIFARNGVNLDYRRVDERIINQILKFKKRQSAHSLMRAFAIADRHLDGKGFLELIGGIENVSAEINITGYKKVPENGELGYVSLNYPIAGKKGILSPLGEIQKKLGMTDGEFLALWIKGRVI
jgi:hypothetical protein